MNGERWDGLFPLIFIENSYWDVHLRFWLGWGHWMEIWWKVYNTSDGYRSLDRRDIKYTIISGFSNISVEISYRISILRDIIILWIFILILSREIFFRIIP